jgi:hypothetical protein
MAIWSILRLFGIFCGHLDFMVLWNMYFPFCTEKTLATLQNQLINHKANAFSCFPHAVIVHATDRSSQRVSFDLNGTEKVLREQPAEEQVIVMH